MSAPGEMDVRGPSASNGGRDHRAQGPVGVGPSSSETRVLS